MLDREQLIEQIEENIAYYDSHSSCVCRHEDGSINMRPTDSALGSADALREILMQAKEYDEPYIVSQSSAEQERIEP